MINVSKIRAALYGIVGIRQPLNPDYAIVDSANQVSRSGYFVTDNELVKMEYVKDGQDYEGISDADFNTYLKQKQEQSIVNVGNAVFNKVDFIDRGLFYKYAMNKQNTVTLPDGFVGYRIQVSDEKNVAIKISRVILDFNGTGVFKLLLWNTGKKEVIESKEITITTDNQVEILDWVVDNTDGTYKGDYYIGYNTNGLSVEPFARDYENSNIESVFTYLNIDSVQVAGHNTETLFDLTDKEAYSDATGFNMDLTVYDDFTDLMTNNESLFANAIKLDMQINLLSIAQASLRSNRHERLSEGLVNKILAEIEGADNGVIKKTGLRSKLYGEISTIQEEVEKLNKGYFGDILFTETIV